jgi:preprotein translocase subunit SecA
MAAPGTRATRARRLRGIADVGIDYLRDTMVMGGRPRRVLGTLDWLSGDVPAETKLLLPGLRCALIDEADRVMLDDSRAPLAVSTEDDQPGERLVYEQALELARTLRESADFTLGPERIKLTPGCSQRLAQLTQALGGDWVGRERREELIALALDALYVAQRDRDYRVIQGRVLFPPPPAEEAVEPSAAQQVLHKLVEVKEGANSAAGARCSRRSAWRAC